MKSIREITIHQPQISLKRSQSGETYFFILDPTTDIAYFAFPERVKGWHELEVKWTLAKEVWIKFNERRKVIALKILKAYPKPPATEDTM